ncbi:MAG: hypothetical protein M3R00_08670, partial [Pseudomonadota bacterium]|nr:hypothetical protein [Pseudomonadota bacterium]
MKKSNSFLENLADELKALQQTEQLRRTKAKVVDESFATIYYDNALTAYLTIIDIIRGYLDSPTKIVALANSNGTDYQKIMEAINKIDSLQYAPRLFHPEYCDDTQTYFFRIDRRCYTLAKTLRLHLDIIRENDTKNKIIEFIKNNFAYLLAQLLHSLENRIARYEYNSEQSHAYD